MRTRLQRRGSRPSAIQRANHSPPGKPTSVSARGFCHWVAPRWDQWQQFAAIPLIDAIFLSVDVDPESRQTLGALAWTSFLASSSDGPIANFDLEDFDRRAAEIAAKFAADYKAEFGPDQLQLPRDPVGIQRETLRRERVAASHMTAGTLRRIAGADDCVALGEFAQWAVGMGWTVPGTFAALAFTANIANRALRERDKPDCPVAQAAGVSSDAKHRTHEEGFELTSRQSQGEKRQQTRIDEIIKIIELLGHDWKQLPTPPPGKEYPVKHATMDALGGPSEWVGDWTPVTFGKAWQGMRDRAKGDSAA